MTLNGVMAVAMRYFTEFGSFPSEIKGLSLIFVSVCNVSFTSLQNCTTGLLLQTM